MYLNIELYCILDLIFKYTAIIFAENLVTSRMIDMMKMIHTRTIAMTSIDPRPLIRLFVPNLSIPIFSCTSISFASSLPSSQA